MYENYIIIAHRAILRKTVTVNVNIENDLENHEKFDKTRAFHLKYLKIALKNKISNLFILTVELSIF